MHAQNSRIYGQMILISEKRKDFEAFVGLILNFSNLSDPQPDATVSRSGGRHSTHTPHIQIHPYGDQIHIL